MAEDLEGWMAEEAKMMTAMLVDPSNDDVGDGGGIWCVEGLGGSSWAHHREAPHLFGLCRFTRRRPAGRQVGGGDARALQCAVPLLPTPAT